MSILICKGTKLQLFVATVYVDIAQLIGISGPGPTPETFEADTLDNASPGIPHKSSGRSEGNSVDFEMFLDPGLAGHKTLLAKLADPPAAADLWKEIYSDATEWPYKGYLVGLTPTVALADGLKASGSIKLDGVPTYPA